MSLLTIIRLLKIHNKFHIPPSHSQNDYFCQLAACVHTCFPIHNRIPYRVLKRLMGAYILHKACTDFKIFLHQINLSYKSVVLWTVEVSSYSCYFKFSDFGISYWFPNMEDEDLTFLYPFSHPPSMVVLYLGVKQYLVPTSIFTAELISGFSIFYTLKFTAVSFFICFFPYLYQ